MRGGLRAELVEVTTGVAVVVRGGEAVTDWLSTDGKVESVMVRGGVRAELFEVTTGVAVVVRGGEAVLSSAFQENKIRPNPISQYHEKVLHVLFSLQRW